jgi:hypothetical protein
MRGLLLSLVLLAALGAPAWAGEVEARQGTISRLEAERVRMEATQRALNDRHLRQLAEVDRLKNRRSGWNAGAKLERAQADANETAKSLNAGQTRIAAAKQQIVVERRALVAAIDRELASQPAPSETRRLQLSRLRSQELARLPAPVKKLKLAQERIDPLDDPEDLDEKAARLRRSEQLLLDELARVDKKVHHFRLQARLEKNRRRSIDDPFADAQKGRKSAHGQTKQENFGTAAETNRGGSSTGGGGAAAPQEPAAGNLDGEDDAAAPPEQGPSGTPAITTAIPADVGVDLTAQYSDVVDQSTLDAVRLAERSSDPEVRARAAERLRDALRAQAERVRQQRQTIERRAKQLRRE